MIQNVADLSGVSKYSTGDHVMKIFSESPVLSLEDQIFSKQGMRIWSGDFGFVHQDVKELCHI